MNFIRSLPKTWKISICKLYLYDYYTNERPLTLLETVYLNFHLYIAALFFYNKH